MPLFGKNYLTNTPINFFSMKYFFFIITFLFLVTACNPTVRDDSKKAEQQITETIIPEKNEEPPLLTEEEIIDSSAWDEEEIVEAPKNWKNLTATYDHFKWVQLDTVRIGADREITSIADYFSEKRANVMVLIDSGKYVYDHEIWITGENVILKGVGNVSIYCDELYKNVLWVEGNNIVIDNLHVMHLMRGESEGQNCSGRVLAFDMADSVTVVNCDLNGCGLAGLHDNLGNGTIWVEHNYIHNNSLGAYTDMDGNVWLDPIPNHSVFKFKNNVMTNNGFERIYEKQNYTDDF